MSNPEHREKEIDLIAGAVLGDLSEAETAEFEAIASTSRLQDREELEFTAAALKLLFEKAEGMDRLPEPLRQKILAASTAHLPTSETNTETSLNLPVTNSSQWLMKSLLACAAAIVIALTVRNSMLVVPIASVSPHVARASLIAGAEDLVKTNWIPGKHPFPANVDGDVIWSNSRQSGFMRFVGMPVNDATAEQDQLWIIDPDRDEEPIDGGVFDIESSGEVVVPINAKLAVLNPAAFAITIEKPGGVVVSTQERLPLIAPVN